MAACAVCKVDGKIALDPSDIEDKQGDADLPIAFMSKSGVVTLLQMDGSLSEPEFNQALDMGIAACRRINDMQIEALKRKYLSVKEQAEERHDPREAQA